MLPWRAQVSVVAMFQDIYVPYDGDGKGNSAYIDLQDPAYFMLLKEHVILINFWK